MQLDIVSPERSVYSAGAEMVEIPGTEGDFGVLPGHAPLISSLRAGVIAVHGAEPKRFFVRAGYAEVTPEGCTILSEHVRDMAGLTPVIAEEELAHAKRVLEHAEDELERTRAAEDVRIAEVLLSALAA